FAERKVTLLMEKGPLAEPELALLDAKKNEELSDLAQWLDTIRQSNEPTVLPEGQFQRLQQLLQRTFLDYDGETRSLLTEGEVFNLSIPKRSLNDNERREIESHALHTYEYLKKIPWSKRYMRIPEIAGKHHEKLNGSGYPFHAHVHEIPMQTK